MRGSPLRSGGLPFSSRAHSNWGAMAFDDQEEDSDEVLGFEGALPLPIHQAPQQEQNCSLQVIRAQNGGRVFANRSSRDGFHEVETRYDRNASANSRISSGKRDSSIPIGVERRMLWTDARVCEEGCMDDEISNGSFSDDQSSAPLPPSPRSVDGMARTHTTTCSFPDMQGSLQVQREPSSFHARRGSGGEQSAEMPQVTSCLPQEHACLFKFPVFNRMQAACWKSLYLGDGNTVLSAPTGAGKTVIFELAILGMLRKAGASTSEFEATGTAVKALYLAPIKALCSERVQDWEQRFAPLGIEVKELTGDTDGSHAQEAGVRRNSTGWGQLRAAHLIVATPEMWDSFTRQAAGNSPVLSSIRLVCLDEVHMLNMPQRGAVLESIVARLRTLRQKEVQEGKRSEQSLRFVAVSATVPNIADVGEWLGTDPGGIHTFGPEYRPVPLRVIVQACRSRNNEFIFQESLNDQLPRVIRQYSGGRATLVFCATKKACETGARSLQKDAGLCQSFQADASRRTVLAQQAKCVSDPNLQQLIPFGIAVHHAGLTPADRRLVADLFLQEAVLVLFCTQTLALGVNLPARLVIVKGTTAYKGSGWDEYDPLEMLQILGRAGRPQFDTEGVAVILADQTLAARWRNHILGDKPIESNLADRLTEALLAEIAARTVLSSEAAATWLRGTFLAVRAGKSPQKYAPLLAVGTGSSSGDATCNHPLLCAPGPDIDAFMTGLCKNELAKLEEAGLLECLPDGTLAVTKLGEVTCKASVRVQTVRQLAQAEAPQNFEEIFKLLVESADFEEFRPKMGEKAKIRAWAKSSIRWKFKGPVDTPAKKVNVLMQLALADPPREKPPWDIAAQQTQILRRSELLMRVFVALFQSRGQGRQLADALLLQKCLKKQIWYDSLLQVRQLPNIGDIGAEKLHSAGFGTLEALAAGDPRYIELALGRRAPFGNQLLSKVRALPRLALRLVSEGPQLVAAMLAPRVFSDSFDDGTEACRGGAAFVHLVAFAAPSAQLIEHRRINALQPPDHISLHLPDASTGITVKLISEDIIGFDDESSLGDISVAVDQQAAKKRRCSSKKDIGASSSEVPATSTPKGTPEPKVPATMSATQLAALNNHSFGRSTTTTTWGDLLGCGQQAGTGVLGTPWNHQAAAAASRSRERAAPAHACAQMTAEHAAALAMARTRQEAVGVSRVQTFRSARPDASQQGPSAGQATMVPPGHHPSVNNFAGYAAQQAGPSWMLPSTPGYQYIHESMSIYGPQYSWQPSRVPVGYPHNNVNFAVHDVSHLAATAGGHPAATAGGQPSMRTEHQHLSNAPGRGMHDAAYVTTHGKHQSMPAAADPSMAPNVHQHGLVNFAGYNMQHVAPLTMFPDHGAQHTAPEACAASVVPFEHQAVRAKFASRDVQHVPLAAGSSPEHHPDSGSLSEHGVPLTGHDSHHAPPPAVGTSEEAQGWRECMTEHAGQWTGQEVQSTGPGTAPAAVPTSRLASIPAFGQQVFPESLTKHSTQHAAPAAAALPSVSLFADQHDPEKTIGFPVQDSHPPMSMKNLGDSCRPEGEASNDVQHEARAARLSSMPSLAHQRVPEEQYHRRNVFDSIGLGLATGGA